MPTEQQISRSITAAEDLESVVSTMKGLSAASLRQYELARSAAERYITNLERGLEVVLRHGFPIGSEEGGATSIGVVLLGTEQGMCGPLNRRVLDHATGWLEDMGHDPPTWRVLAIGTRLGDELVAHRIRAERLLPQPSSATGVHDRVMEILLLIDGWRAEGVGEVVAFHHTRFEQVRADPVTRHILPIEAGLLHRLRDREWPTRMIPQLATGSREVFAALTRQLVVGRLFVALVDALASEHGERLIAMQSAESNIEERLEELRAAHRRERQSAITSELLDIISGYEIMTQQGTD
jgi:F-type H+-transporting ATPase subunit gamma